MKVKTNTVFEWTKGFELTARQDVVVAIPSKILDGTYSLHETIELCNESTEVAFQENRDHSGVSLILIRLSQGRSMRVMRSMEVVFLSNTEHELYFDVEQK